MNSVLDSIIAGVLEDVKAREISVAQIKEQIDAAPIVRDAYATLCAPGIQIIAEVKRSSPSKGVLASIIDPSGLARKYEEAGAAVISVLTEGRRFGGSTADLVAVRNAVRLPVLRKDFTVTEFQVYETRALGSDMILLIVAALSNSQLRDYQSLSQELGLSVLVEVHDEAELERAVSMNAQIIGVNARNLKTLSIHEEVFTRLLPLIPDDRLKIAESGIATRAQVEIVEELGAKALLIGETLVRAGDPRIAINTLLGR